jgi:hypothetical protein
MYFFPGEWVQTLSRKDKKTKQVKQEEDNNTKAKKRAQKDAKRITAELIAKAKKDSENAQQLAKQVLFCCCLLTTVLMKKSLGTETAGSAAEAGGEID